MKEQKQRLIRRKLRFKKQGIKYKARQGWAFAVMLGMLACLTGSPVSASAFQRAPLSGTPVSTPLAGTPAVSTPPSGTSVSTAQVSSDEVPERMKRDYVTMAGIFSGLSGKSDSYQVKRGEFAKILKLASIEKGKKMPKVRTSLYKDVTKKNTYAPYIRLAVKKGWMSGYVNGTFRPGKAVTYRDAAKACVVLLGYGVKEDQTVLTGNALMEQFYDMEISNVLSVSESHRMTKRELELLFYEVLASSANTSGTAYCQSIGLAVDEDGAPDFGKLLVKKAAEPVLVSGDWKKEIPFVLQSGRLYRNGEAAAESQIKDYDVLYYLKDTSSVYAYGNKVTGTFDAVTLAQNSSIPKSVVVSGETYVLGGKQAKAFFGSDGTMTAGQGDEVTLLFGADGKIAFAVDEAGKEQEVTGVVADITTKTSSSVKDSYIICHDMAVVDTKGELHHFLYDYNNNQYRAGDAVTVTVSPSLAGAETTITKLAMNRGLLGGEVWQESGKKIGKYVYAADLKIYDITEGVVTRLYPSELDGVRFPSAAVLYYELEGTTITSLMVKEMTDGGTGVYGVVNKIKVKDTIMMEDDRIEYVYELTTLINGKEETAVYNGSELFGSYGNGTPSKITVDEWGTHYHSLSAVNVTGFSGKTIYTDGGKRYYDDSVLVCYQTKGRVSYPITYEKLKSLAGQKKTIRAYYVSESGKAKKVRMLVAYE